MSSMIRNSYNLPKPIVDAICAKTYTPSGDSDVYATALIRPPMMNALEHAYQENNDGYHLIVEEDVRDRFALFVGESIHLLLEDRLRNVNGYYPEVRVRTTVDDYVISGYIDLVRVVGGVHLIYDYKTQLVMSHELSKGKPKQDWVIQLNMYAYMLRHSEIENDINPTVGDSSEIRACVLNVFKDWNTGVAARRGMESGKYPEKPATTSEVQVMEDSSIESMMRTKIHSYRNAIRHGKVLSEKDSGVEYNSNYLADNVRSCTSSEMWERSDTYAVKKPKSKRAIRVFNTKEEAHKLANTKDEYFVECRKGERVRCSRFCKYAPVCPTSNGHI